ncbi:MAG: hypothetical protein AB7F59_00235 [Bdellovibrionales bacterium]
MSNGILLASIVLLSQFLSYTGQTQEQASSKMPPNKFVETCDVQRLSPTGDNKFYEQLKTWSAATPAVDSVEYFKKLVSLPEYKEFSLGSMRMAHSRSLQMAATSPTHPRLITFHSGGVIMGLVDAPVPIPVRYAQKIDGIRYNFEQNSWEPFVGQISSAGTKFSMDPKDTKTCFSCHGTPFRPIWRTYSAWPGQFQANSAPMEFYEKDRFYPMTVHQPDTLGQILTIYLNGFNYKRIHSELKKNPNWTQFRTAAIANLIGCSNIPDFVGPANSPLRKKLEGGNPQRFAQLKAEVEKTVNYNHQRDIEFSKAINDRGSLAHLARFTDELEDASRMAGLKYLFESSGTNVKAFSMSRPPLFDGYGFNQVGTYKAGVMNLLCQILPEYAVSPKSSKQVLEWEVQKDISSPELCAELKIESLRNTKNGTLPLLL